MTDDRPTETESPATLAALYRILEDARRYEEYAKVRPARLRRGARRLFLGNYKKSLAD